MKYKYILFDADNTLFNFSAGEYNSFRAMCVACGFEFTEDGYKTYSAINDSLWKRLEKGGITVEFLKTERFRLYLTQKLGWLDDDKTLAKAEEMRRVYMDNLAHQSIPMEGAVDICKYLYGKYKLYIITNGISHIQRSRFSGSEISPYIEDMFISEEIGFAKPAREYFDYVLTHAGSGNREEYLVVGDSLTSDCDGAIAAGIDICRFNPENKPSMGRELTYNIEKLSELKAIL